MEQSFFLQALGWSILNSIWQMGLLTLLYTLVVNLFPNLPALSKHRLGSLLFFSGGIWFLFTGWHNWQLLRQQEQVQLFPFTHFSLELHHSLLGWMAVLYTLMLMYLLTKLLIQMHQTHRLRSNTLKAPATVRIFVAQQAARMGIAFHVAVRLSPIIDVPSVVGYCKPLLLLPVACINHLSTEQLEAILIHELAHVRRHDFLINILQALVEWLMFFNPFAKILSRSIKREREHCCDDWVLNHRYQPQQYARALLQLEELRIQHWPLVLAATNQKGALLKRVKRLFGGNPTPVYHRKWQLWLSSLVTACLLMGCYLLVPTLSSTSNTRVAKNQTQQRIVAPWPSKENSAHFVNNTLATLPSSSSNDVSANIQQAASLGHPTSSYSSKLVREEEPIMEEPYTEALINEDQLTVEPEEATPVATQLLEDSMQLNNGSVIIKIVEQTAGKPDKTTYILQVSQDGTAKHIKPLLLMKQYPKLVQPKKKSTPKPQKEQITS